MKKVLLHICCGVCSAGVIDKLENDGFKVVGLFFNPNIQPKAEYEKRLGAAKTVADMLKIEFVTGIYEPESWFLAVKGLEDEPEAGMRCRICYRMRLEAAFNKAKELSSDYFATTLSISPHKDTEVINEIGKKISSESFLAYDFKKDNGFKKGNDFAKKNIIYRQNYCGCIFSVRT